MLAQPDTPRIIDVVVGHATNRDKLLVIRRDRGESNDLGLEDLFGVSRQTISAWRRGAKVSDENQLEIDRLYARARARRIADGRTQIDWRRRAESYLGLIDDDSSLELACEFLAALATPDMIEASGPASDPAGAVAAVQHALLTLREPRQSQQNSSA